MNWGASAPQDEPRWEQPDFSASTAPTVSGVVLRPGETSVPVVKGVEEQRLRMIRRLVVPIVLIGGLITGLWWQFILVGVVTSVVLRRRIWQLRFERFAEANRVASGPTEDVLR